MARKRKRKKSRIQLFAWVKPLFLMLGGLVLRVFPFVLITGLLTAGGFGVRQVLYADPGLTIRKIEVIPPMTLPESEVRRIEAELLGKNVFEVDLKKVSRRIRTNPEILEAKVLRQFPDQVAIHIKKRGPVAVIQLPNQVGYAVLAEDAMVIDIVKVSPEGLFRLELELSVWPSFKKGRRVKIRGFDEGIAFAKTYRTLPVSAQAPMEKLRLDHLGAVSFMIVKGPEIRLGTRPLETVPYLSGITTVLENQDGGKVEYMEIRNDRFIVKKR